MSKYADRNVYTAGSLTKGRLYENPHSGRVFRAVSNTNGDEVGGQELKNVILIGDYRLLVKK